MLQLLRLAISAYCGARFKSFVTCSGGVLNERRKGNSERISKPEFRFILRASAAFGKPDLISIDLNSGIDPPSRGLMGIKD